METVKLAVTLYSSLSKVTLVLQRFPGDAVSM